ncbi:MAG TPA: acetolactate synthase large subunit [Acidimicrobiales bacterium]|nr:acetolactate synthase large subunit [Acidimicrobiales bacterium]
MNGARALIRTLADAGVDLCITNPGTSEMHFVAALDDVPEMRAVLGLFEGAVTGAADGYGRMADRPAATLLHLGPGLGNGLANLHNARRARTPVVNIVGDHATHHERYDAPLQSDIEGVARNVSRWYRRTTRTEDLAGDAADAVAAALGPPGQVATLVLPADVSWNEGAEPATAVPPTARTVVADDTVEAVAKVLLGGEPAVLLLGGSALREPALVAAGQVASATGARLMGETFPARLQRGAGIPAVERIPYLGEMALALLAGTRHLVLVDAPPPVSFFAYPDKPSDLVPDGCEVHVLAGGSEDAAGALAHLAERVGTGHEVERPPAVRPGRPTGALTAQSVAEALGALLPDGAIVADEANTSGLFAPGATAGCPPHDWLTNCGGSIGIGIPLATGAALACPDRPVVCLQADGSGMYTLQALWTQARENLDVTTIVFTNRSYAILNMELDRVGAGAGGPKALDMLDISRPDLDFAALARGMGVDAVTATTADELTGGLARALAERGPHLIDAVLGG